MILIKMIVALALIVGACYGAGYIKSLKEKPFKKIKSSKKKAKTAKVVKTTKAKKKK